MKKDSWGSKIGYGVGDIYAGGAFLLIGLLFVNFLTDVVGLRPVLAGIIFGFGEIWDAFTDPIMGYISDRTKSRFGRRRIYFIAGVLPVFLSFFMLWLDIGSENEWVLFVYFLFAYTLFNTVFTMVMVPYNALLPNMITDYVERTSYNTVRLTCSAFAAILSGVVPMLIVNAAPNRHIGYIWMGLSFGLLYALPWIFVFTRTWENPVLKKEANASLKMIGMEFLKSFRNRSFRIHTSFFVAGQTAVDFLTTVFIYYLTYVLNRASEFSAVLGTLLVVQLFSMSIHGKISKTYGKTVPLRIGFSVWLVGMFIALFISRESPWYLIYFVAALSGFGAASSTFVPWSILPEISDVDELITGERREGIYAGMSTLIRKVAQAMSVQVITLVLEIVDYVPNVPQTPTSLMGIRLLFFVGPVIFMILAFIAAGRYKMTEERHHMLMTEIQARKDGQQPSQNPEIIAICENLTGQPYKHLARFNG